jgi:hypothetical protein
MSTLESRSIKDNALATVNVNRHHYESIGLHQQCKLVSIDMSDIVYYHSIVGKMKFDYTTFMPSMLKEKLNELLGNQ